MPAGRPNNTERALYLVIFALAATTLLCQILR
jgi:hypothetical protein